MRARGYRRWQEKRHAERLMREQLGALELCEVYKVNTPLTPIAELLCMHPAPWTAETIGGNRANTIVRDALGYDVWLPGWGQALAEVVNSAQLVNAEHGQDARATRKSNGHSSGKPASWSRLQWERD